jgi:hypothetical protein
MNAGAHDTLVYRLAQMLVKLNQGERLDPQALADEFGVTRTRCGRKTMQGQAKGSYVVRLL